MLSPSITHAAPPSVESSARISPSSSTQNHHSHIAHPSLLHPRNSAKQPINQPVPVTRLSPSQKNDSEPDLAAHNKDPPAMHSAPHAQPHLRPSITCREPASWTEKKKKDSSSAAVNWTAHHRPGGRPTAETLPQRGLYDPLQSR